MHPVAIGALQAENSLSGLPSIGFPFILLPILVVRWLLNLSTEALISYGLFVEKLQPKCAFTFNPQKAHFGANLLNIMYTHTVVWGVSDTFGSTYARM